MKTNTVGAAAVVTWCSMDLPWWIVNSPRKKHNKTLNRNHGLPQVVQEGKHDASAEDMICI